jgi:hypothetical protein
LLMKKKKKKEESTREGLFVSGKKKKKEKRGEKEFLLMNSGKKGETIERRRIQLIFRRGTKRDESGNTQNPNPIQNFILNRPLDLLSLVRTAGPSTLTLNTTEMGHFNH